MTPVPVLAATEWGDRDGPTVVLLHGMLASAEYWREVACLLPGRRVIALDLLGFGASPRPGSAEYDYADHCAAVLATLAGLDVREPVVLVGHSMGALIALRLAVDSSGLAGSLCLLGMPVFGSAAEGRATIGSSRLRRALVYGVTSWLLCHVWCQAMRPVSRRLARLYVRGVPPTVASATVDHSWRSYSRSLANVVEKQTAAADLARLACPTLIVYGDQDEYATVPLGNQLPARVRVVSLTGGHQLPVQRPTAVAELIRDLSEDLRVSPADEALGTRATRAPSSSWPDRQASGGAAHAG